jgi:hypothetical protein
MTFLAKVVLAFQPMNDYLVPFLGFNALVTLVLTALVALVILQNRRKNQSITSEGENLIRRYIIFRARRHALMKTHQGDEKVKHEMLKAISSSWNHFRSILESHSIALHETDRQARKFLCILGIVMLFDSFRKLVSGAPIDRMHWGGLVFLVRELPMYFFLLTGFLLISIQSRRWKKRAPTSFDGELDAIFSDTEQNQEALDNEFDPIEPSPFHKEESWPEGS